MVDLSIAIGHRARRLTASVEAVTFDVYGSAVTAQWLPEGLAEATPAAQRCKARLRTREGAELPHWHGGLMGFYGCLMGFYGGLMGFYGGLMGFYGGLMGFYGGLMGFYGGLMGFYGGLMGFYGGLMGFYGGLMVV